MAEGFSWPILLGKGGESNMALVVLRSGEFSGFVVEAFSQEGCQERRVEHGAS